MKVKQYATKQPTDHWRNKRGNKYLETNENESTSIQNPWDTAKAVLKGDHSRTILPQETRKISNNLALHLKQLQKEEQTKPKVGRRKEIIKIKAEINKIDTKKKQLQRSMKLKACSLKR